MYVYQYVLLSLHSYISKLYGNLHWSFLTDRISTGTTSTLLFERPRDVYSEKFDDWPFLSVHFWGEKAAGTWRLIVTNAGTRQVHHPGQCLVLFSFSSKENCCAFSVMKKINR